MAHLTYQITVIINDHDNTKQFMQSPGYSYQFYYQMLAIKRAQV